MPARKYRVTEVHSESYRELFEYVIKNLIPELGLRGLQAPYVILQSRQPGRINCFSGGVLT